MRQGQSIKHVFQKQTGVVKKEYRIQLNASVDVARYLLKQGLPFRAHDERADSSSKRIFLELVKYIAA